MSMRVARRCPIRRLAIIQHSLGFSKLKLDFSQTVSNDFSTRNTSLKKFINFCKDIKIENGLSINFPSFFLVDSLQDGACSVGQTPWEGTWSAICSTGGKGRGQGGAGSEEIIESETMIDWLGLTDAGNM